MGYDLNQEPNYNPGHNLLEHPDNGALLTHPVYMRNIRNIKLQSLKALLNLDDSPPHQAMLTHPSIM